MLFGATGAQLSGHKPAKLVVVPIDDSYGREKFGSVESLAAAQRNVFRNAKPLIV